MALAYARRCCYHQPTKVPYCSVSDLARNEAHVSTAKQIQNYQSKTKGEEEAGAQDKIAWASDKPNREEQQAVLATAIKADAWYIVSKLEQFTDDQEHNMPRLKASKKDMEKVIIISD